MIFIPVLMHVSRICSYLTKIFIIFVTIPELSIAGFYIQSLLSPTSNQPSSTFPQAVKPPIVAP